MKRCVLFQRIATDFYSLDVWLSIVDCWLLMSESIKLSFVDTVFMKYTLTNMRIHTKAYFFIWWSQSILADVLWLWSLSCMYSFFFMIVILTHSFAYLPFPLLVPLAPIPISIQLTFINNNNRQREQPHSEKDTTNRTRHAVVAVKYPSTSRRRRVPPVDTPLRKCVISTGEKRPRAGGLLEPEGWGTWRLWPGGLRMDSERVHRPRRRLPHKLKTKYQIKPMMKTLEVKIVFCFHSKN